MHRVEVSDMLAARDVRRDRQNTLRSQWNAPLISFTMNIPGPVKYTPEIRCAFDEGKGRINAILEDPAFCVLAYEEQIAFTGCEGLWAVQGDAEEIKKALCRLEEQDELGRLFDMDVMDASGSRLSREQERTCLLCGAPARVCGRSRAHDVQLLFDKAEAIIRRYFEDKLARDMGEICQRALFCEVMTTPKPGLVDLENNGAHEDMDLTAFVNSICVLRPYFEACVRYGIRNAGYEALRILAIEAEADMYHRAKCNTHKGAVFSMGILCYAVGCTGNKTDVPKILQFAAQAGGYYLDKMASSNRVSTGGEQQYRQYGLTGARGEAASGFESVVKYGLPALEQEIQAGKSITEGGLHALLALMACVQDSNVIRKGGLQAQAWMQAQAVRLLRDGFTADDLRALNQEFVNRRISPGGCADLLAVTYLLHMLSQDVQEG